MTFSNTWVMALLELTAGREQEADLRNLSLAAGVSVHQNRNAVSMGGNHYRIVCLGGLEEASKHG